MKYIQQVTLSACIFLFSCTKDSPSPITQTTTASLSFTADGTSYNVNGTDALVLEKYDAYPGQVPPGVVPRPGYHLISQKLTKGFFEIIIPTTTALTQTTYLTTRSTYPSIELSGFFPSKGVDYSYRNNGDFMAVTITKISNGLASGTFTVQFSNTTKVISITNGTFENVQIVE